MLSLNLLFEKGLSIWNSFLLAEDSLSLAGLDLHFWSLIYSLKHHLPYFCSFPEYQLGYCLAGYPSPVPPNKAVFYWGSIPHQFRPPIVSQVAPSRPIWIQINFWHTIILQIAFGFSSC